MVSPSICSVDERLVEPAVRPRPSSVGRVSPVPRKSTATKTPPCSMHARINSAFCFKSAALPPCATATTSGGDARDSEPAARMIVIGSGIGPVASRDVGATTSTTYGPTVCGALRAASSSQPGESTVPSNPPSSRLSAARNSATSNSARRARAAANRSAAIFCKTSCSANGAASAGRQRSSSLVRRSGYSSVGGVRPHHCSSNG